MKILKNKSIRLNIFALIAFLLTTACSQVKTAEGSLQLDSASAKGLVAEINAKPAVVWSKNPEENKLYEKKFLVPDDYFEHKPLQNSKRDGMGNVFLATPNLESLSNTKKSCRFESQTRLSCFTGVLKIIVGVDLDRQDYKDYGKNVINILNDFKKDPKGNLGSLKWDHYLPTQYGIYGFDEAYFIDLPAARQQAADDNHEGYELSRREDSFFKYDKQTNVLIHVRCLAKDIPHGYFYKNGLLHAKCEHMFTVKSLNREIYISYDREYLPQWQQLQDSALDLINQFNQADVKGIK